MVFSEIQKLVQDIPQAKESFENGIVPICNQFLQAQENSFAENSYVLPPLIQHHLTGDLANLFATFNLSPTRTIILLSKEAAFRQRCHFLSTVQELNTWGSDDWQKMQWSKNKYNGPASLYEDTAQIYQESKINLNIQRIYAQDGLSDRVFNIMMAGGFLLADRNESITELFEEEKHMALFSNRDEMNEKINFYLTNDSARKKIEEAGQKEVLAHHSCLNRIEHIIKRIQDKA